MPARLLKRLGTGKQLFAGKSPEPVKEKTPQRGDPLYKKEKKPKPAQVKKQVEKVQFASATELYDDKSSECIWCLRLYIIILAHILNLTIDFVLPPNANRSVCAENGGQNHVGDRGDQTIAENRCWR